MHIYNSKTKKLKSFTSLHEAIDFFAKQSQTELPNIFFWNEGSLSWTLAQKILTADVIANKSFDMPELPTTHSEAGAPALKLKDTENDFRVIEVVNETAAPAAKASEKTLNKPDTRRFKRYDVRLKVIISNKQKTFLSYSKNVSEGGILLEDRIPNYMFNEESEVFISAPNKKEIIAFRCQPIGDEENPNRLKFKESQTDYIEKLKVWLESLQTQS